MKTYLLLISLLCALAFSIMGCSREADIASRNLSYAADEFQIQRRIVFYNGITGEYMLTIEGLCSLGNQDTAQKLSVTCKTGPGTYKKHFLGLSDNVTFFSEQVESAGVSAYRYKVSFRPASILPDVEIK